MYKYLLCILLCLILAFANAQPVQLPFVQRQSDSTYRLIVDGKPYLALAGELGNSTASDAAYMRTMWPRLKAMHLNTVLAPVYWEIMEPQEGKFDFSLVDSMLLGARKNGLKLCLLWFGTWKNSMSCYAPAWVKENEKRFERATNGEGKNQEILSAFDSDNIGADTKAFIALMNHIKQVDKKQQTVLMIQVENEIGFLTDAREHTSTANLKFDEQVPAELSQYLQKSSRFLMPELAEMWQKNGAKTNGTWKEVFGEGVDADEIFQAWYYAKYADAVAKAGKQIYNLPMFVNAALNYKNVRPGQYPSAGPLPHIADIWKAAAPHIDMLSPDYYNPYFTKYSDLYTRGSNPFFIPEMSFDSATAIKVFSAVGRYHTMGFSPFAIETGSETNNDMLTKSYALLEQLQPILYSSKKTDGFLVNKTISKDSMLLGHYKLIVQHDNTLGWNKESKDSIWTFGGGIIIPLSDDEFIIAGTGIVTTVQSTKPNTAAGILQADEGSFIKGVWKPYRRLNGDQTHQGRHIRLPIKSWSIQWVKLYEYSAGK
jgi:hypothetical protein